MSRVVANMEAAAAAETQTEVTLDRVLDRLHGYNHRLGEIHHLLRQIQDKSSGSVLLELYACGRGCKGCPHPRWMQYFWKSRPTVRTGERDLLVAVNLCAAGKDPYFHLPRKHPQFQEMADLVREAKAILKKKSTLLSRLRALERVL